MSSPKNYRLLCLGNPLLDIQVFADQALLDKYDMALNQTVLAEPRHDGLYDDLLANYDAKLLPGGAAQNTARGAQYMLPPNSVVYVGGVGDDKYGATLIEAAKKAGLRVEYRTDPKIPTGRCGVVVTGQSRTMVTDLGAANHYTLEHLKQPEIWALAEGADVFFIGGYHFTVCPPAIMALCKEAASKNKITLLSLAAAFIPEFYTAPLDESLPYLDYIIGNEDEAAAFAKTHDFGTTDLKEIATKIANLPKENKQRKRVAIITHGKEPTIVAIQGESDIKEYPVRAIESSSIVDTTGAGDAFAAGLTAGVVEGKSLDVAIDMGQWLALKSIQELGPS